MTKLNIEPLLVDIETVASITGLSKSTVQGLIRNDKFPKPRQASAQRVCFLLREVKEWAESRPIANLLPPANCAAGGRNGSPNTKAIRDKHQAL